MPKCSECVFEGDYVNDLYMKCKAPGGGPTANPVSKRESLIDYPCGFFKAKGPAAAPAKKAEVSAQEAAELYGKAFTGSQNEFTFLLRDNPYLAETSETEAHFEASRKQLLSNNRMVAEYSFKGVGEFCEGGNPTPLGISRVFDGAENGKTVFNQGPLVPAGLNGTVLEYPPREEEAFTIAWNLSTTRSLSELGLTVAGIRGYSVELKFFPTDSYPLLVMVLGIDDGKKNGLGQPDMLFSEYYLSVKSNRHIVRLYQLLGAKKLRVILLHGGAVLHSGMAMITDNTAMKTEVKKWWNSLPDYDERLKDKENWTKGIHQYADNFKVGGTPTTPKGEVMLKTSNQYVSPVSRPPETAREHEEPEDLPELFGPDSPEAPAPDAPASPGQQGGEETSVPHTVEIVREYEKPSDTGETAPPGEEEASASPAKKAGEVSRGVRVFDYVLSGICGLELLWQLYNKLFGSGTREWIWVLLPGILAVGLLQHKTLYRVLCVIILLGSILLPFILLGTL